MKSFPTVYLILSLPFMVAGGCASEYALLKPVPFIPACANKLNTIKVETSWYHAGVDVAGRHFSGLLIIKDMPDSSQRVVFTSEAGLTFFDFEFTKNGAFMVHNIIKKMDRKAVVRTLQKDFGLLLGIPFRSGTAETFSAENNFYTGVRGKKESVWCVTDNTCTSLQKLELGSKRKKKVTIEVVGAGFPLPDTINIRHFIFPMQLQLLRFERK